MLVPLPDLPGLFEGIDWSLDVPQQKSRSEFTKRTKVIGMPGAEGWLASAMVLPDASQTETRAWRTFIVSCRGSENSFRLPAEKPWPAPAAEPTVTAAITGNRAVTVSSTAELATGMYATVEQANGYFRLVVIVALDGSDVHFEPYLTGDPKIDATFRIAAPFCPMRLSGNALKLPNRARPTGFTFEADEAFEVSP